MIRDDSSYARLWASLGAGERPAVDFSRDIVIAAASGQRATGGNAIAVERVTRTRRAPNPVSKLAGWWRGAMVAG